MKVTRGMAADAFHIGVYAGPKLLVDGRALDIEEGSIANGDAQKENDPRGATDRRGPLAAQWRLRATGKRRRRGSGGGDVMGRATAADVFWLWSDASYAGAAAGHVERRPAHRDAPGATGPLAQRVGRAGFDPFRAPRAGVVTELQTTWSLLPGVRVNPDPSFRAAVERCCASRAGRVPHGPPAPRAHRITLLPWDAADRTGLPGVHHRGRTVLSAGSASFAAGASSPAAVFSAVADSDFRRLRAPWRSSFARSLTSPGRG